MRSSVVFCRFGCFEFKTSGKRVSGKVVESKNWGGGCRIVAPVPVVPTMCDAMRCDGSRTEGSGMDRNECNDSSKLNGGGIIIL